MMLKLLEAALDDPCGIDSNPRSSLFLKLHCGRLSMSFMGGMENYIKLLSQLDYKVAEGQEVIEEKKGVEDSFFNRQNLQDIATKWILSRNPPIIGMATELISNRDYKGDVIYEDFWGMLGHIVKGMGALTFDTSEELASDPQMEGNWIASGGLFMASVLGANINVYSNDMKNKRVYDYIKKANYKTHPSSYMRGHGWEDIKTDRQKQIIRERAYNLFSGWLKERLIVGDEPTKEVMNRKLERACDQALVDYNLGRLEKKVFHTEKDLLPLQ
jgi:hypothetical protein